MKKLALLFAVVFIAVFATQTVLDNGTTNVDKEKIVRPGNG